MTPRRLLRVGAVGTVVTAICCFTPILVWLLAALGIGWLAGALDYVLFPLLAIFIAVLVYAAFRVKTTDG